MNRPRSILTALLACLVVVLAAMAWVSVVVIQSDRRDAETQRQAELQEDVRLALWRLDSALNPLVSQEQSRPFYEYQSFYTPLVTLDAAHRPIPDRNVVLPSPLLLRRPPFVKLHFQIGADGRLLSPQVPEGTLPDSLGPGGMDRDQMAAAEDLRALAGRLNRSALFAAIPDQGPETGRSRQVASAEPALAADDGPQAESQKLLDDLQASNALAQSTVPPDRRQSGRARNIPSQQALRSDMEYQQRVESNVQSKLLGKFTRYGETGPEVSSSGSLAAADGETPALPSLAGLETAIEGDMHPLWVDQRLLLVRRVVLGKEAWIQGCWLDWEALRAWLGQRISDLLPEAKLVAAEGPVTEGDRRSPYLLASLPVRLVPGRRAAADESLSPAIRTSLVVAWLCTALAVVALVVMVLGLNALSERRAAFVSAVTHELRTPLTTFRIYTEMLAKGMVPDEARRREYLETLRGESDRLAQLIENVLAYARLEGRRATAQAEEVTIGQLVDRFATRVRQRADQSQMLLDLAIDDAVRDVVVRTDASVVEQIVANLVDNACKYGSNAADRRIQVAVITDSRWLRLRVADRGPGVAADVARRLFRPFSRSAQEAANSAPGVGLGLALSRRLARQLGGNLVLLPSHPKGACFELQLPRFGDRSFP